MNKNYADAYNNKCVAPYNLRKYYEAIFYYNKAIKINPNNPEGYNNKGNSL